MAEDILGGRIYRGIAAPGRAGWPTAHVGQLRWPCRSPFGLAAVVGEATPCWQAKESHRIMLQNARAVHELDN